MTAEAIVPSEIVTRAEDAWTELVQKTRNRKSTEKSEFRRLCEETYQEYGCRVPLPEAKEMRVREFARSAFFSECISGRIYRSNVPDPADPEKTITIRGWWYDDGKWIGLSHDYWAGTVRYFRGALCEHQYKSLPRRWNCYHEAICVKCGHYSAYDSGD